MSAKNENVEVKMEYDVEDFKTEVNRRCSEVLRSLGEFLDRTDKEIESIYDLVNSHPDSQAMREIFPRTWLTGMRFKIKGNRGTDPCTLVATFWNKEMAKMTKKSDPSHTDLPDKTKFE